MKIIFKGVVQGVGFRPTIFRLAKKHKINGYVVNKGSEVEVVIDKNPEQFINLVKKNLPAIAQITEVITVPDSRTFNDFKILHSINGERQSHVPADIGICNECLKELFDVQNRRCGFPFTNCTLCGARYSLISDVPYDRERTSMDEFKLCESCQKEYRDPSNRRYHAQTISCHECGPRYKAYDKKHKEIKENNPIEFFAEQIDLGKIGIIKSWGGMHICCKLNEIPRFREWYGRSQKAFAVMVKDIETAEKYGKITPDEKELLLSNNRPIVLVEKKKAESASPGLNTLGLYLPYTGLHHLLFSNLKAEALVMTSANIPGEPMLTTNEEAFNLKAEVYLLHNRSIPNRIDDSVLRTWHGNTFFLRKSRGFVPDPIKVSYDSHILSVGAGENITGAFSSDNNLYATQYIGNSKYYSVVEFLEESLRHLMKLTMKKKEIDAVAMDIHPGYDSRKVAKMFSEEFSAPLFEIQHHWAHAASLLLDNNVDRSVVLTLDGLGYGSDGAFWGGEVLGSDFNCFERIGHLEPIPLIGGDKATYDPRRLVFGIFKTFNENKFFTGSEADILGKLIDKSPMSTSLGRVLDAIACYLNICTKRTYDGEPAMKLEKYLAMGKPTYSFDVNVKNGVVGTIDLFRQLDEKMKKNVSESKKADLAYSIVKTIVDNLTDIAITNAKSNRIKTVGVTGGVAYNIPITEMIDKKVKKEGLELLVHNRVPNGDGGISLGQNIIADFMLK